MGLGTACGRARPPVQGSGAQRVAVGPIADHVKRLQEPEDTYYQDACDRDPEVRRMQKELAQVLDAKQDEIVKLALAQPPSKAFRTVPLGPIQVRERVQPAEPEDKWSDDEYGWKRIYAYYLGMKDAPPTDTRWLSLNAQVREILPDDEDRLDGVNLTLDKDAPPRVAEALNAVTACLAEEAGCREPLANPVAQDLIHSNPLYKRILREEGWTTLGRRLFSDLARHRMHPNPKVRRTSQRELVLPMEAGPLASV